MKFIIVMFLILISKFSNDYTYRDVEIVETQEQLNEFSYENLKQALETLEVSNPDIILKQAKLESGNFKSDVFKENNNFMGMRQPRVRETTAIGSNKGHAVYEDWYDCVKDIVLFQEYYANRISKSVDYYDFLGQVYAVDLGYVNKLKQMNI